MSHLQTPECSEKCDHGFKNFYFKNESTMSVRHAGYVCIQCYPDTLGIIMQLNGEEIIEGREFFYLRDIWGWEEKAITAKVSNLPLYPITWTQSTK